MGRIADINAGKFLDVLNERLTFERAGVKLYDRVLAALRSSPTPVFQDMVADMQEHRDEEKEHEEWLEAQIRSLGGTAHEQTELSELVTRESEGLEKVIQGDPEVSHMLHALLAAELVDNAGWDLLVQLADEAGDHRLKHEFKKRWHEEEEHLLYMRKAVERLSFNQVLGEDISAP